MNECYRSFVLIWLIWSNFSFGYVIRHKSQVISFSLCFTNVVNEDGIKELMGKMSTVDGFSTQKATKPRRCFILCDVIEAWLKPLMLGFNLGTSPWSFCLFIIFIHVYSFCLACDVWWNEWLCWWDYINVRSSGNLPMCQKK